MGWEFQRLSLWPTVFWTVVSRLKAALNQSCAEKENMGVTETGFDRRIGSKWDVKNK